MRAITFAKRNLKEIIRDPLAFIFAIVLPVFLLFIFQQFNIPSDVYNISNFAPSIIIFGFSFITLFTATLISKDRYSSLLSRLFASPLKSYEYILGYTLALLPVALFQSVLFIIVACFLGLPISINLLITIVAVLPVSLLFIALGILIGSLVNDKASPGIGSIVVQLVAFTSGMYFDASMLGGVLETISKILPFSYAVDVARASIQGTLPTLGLKSLIIVFYIIIVFIISSYIFKLKMISDNK